MCPIRIIQLTLLAPDSWSSGRRVPSFRRLLLNQMYVTITTLRCNGSPLPSFMLSEGLIRIGTSHLRHSPFTLSTVSFSNLCKYIAHRIHSCLHCGSHTSSLSSVLTVISNSTEQHSTQSLLYIFITIYGSTRKNIQIEYTYM